MLLKSVLLALVGSALAVVITLFRQYKHQQLQQLAAEQKEQENKRM
jgi:hypothetical protein